MEKRKVWRWIVLVASMWLQGFAGVGYAFGSYSPILKARLRLDQTQMNILGVAKDLGDSVGLLAGIFSEILPPSALIFTGAVQNLVGYALIWLIAIAVIPPPPFIVVCIIMLVATNGESYFNTAALVACVRTFPQNRGPIVGILKGYAGLTGAIITIFYAALFAPHQSFYIFLVALLPSAVAFIVMFIIKPIEHVKCKKKQEDRSFKFLYCVLLALAPYMMVVLLLQDFINMTRAVSIVFLLVFIMFQLAPLAIPLKLALSKEDDIVNNKKKVSSIEEGLKTPLLGPEKISKELAKAVATDDAESSQIPAALVRPPSLVPHVSRFNPAPDSEPSQAPTLSRPPLLARSPSSQFPPPLPRSPSSQFIPALIKSPSSLLPPLPRSPSTQFTPSMIKSPSSQFTIKSSPSFQFVPPLLKSPSGQIMPPLSRSSSTQFPPLSRSSSQWLNESFYFSEVEDEKLAAESEALPEEVRQARAAELEARLYLAVAEGAIKIRTSRRGPRRGEDFTVGQALVKADFWLLFLALFSGAGSGLTVIDNLGQMAIAQGYSNAHIFVSMFSIWNFVGRLGGGYISEIIARDYVFPRGITVAASCLFLGVGHIVFAIAFPGSLYMGTLFSGLGYGALWSIVPATASELFGLKSFGALYNILCVANPAGSLIFSGIIAGCLYDREAKRQNGHHNNLNVFTSLHFITDSVQNPDEWVCSGVWCFRSTYIIMTGICVIATMLSLVLTYRTRSVYLSLYGKKEPQKNSPNGAVSPTKDWFTNLKREDSLLPD